MNHKWHMWNGVPIIVPQWAIDEAKKNGIHLPEATSEDLDRFAEFLKPDQFEVELMDRLKRISQGE